MTNEEMDDMADALAPILWRLVDDAGIEKTKRMIGRILDRYAILQTGAAEARRAELKVIIRES